MAASFFAKDCKIPLNPIAIITIPSWTPTMKKYKPGVLLGEGSVGVTYACTNRTTNKEYACKFLPKSVIDKTEGLLEQVQLELNILKLLKPFNYPHIIQLEESLEDDDFVYIVMELCEGGTLENHLNKYGPFTEIKAAKVIKEIVTALAKCHNKGIIHRDLKLNNVLYQTKDEDSKVKLIDFGLSNWVRKDKKLSGLCGNPFFMAPEMISRNKYGPKVDIWSGGVALYTMLGGHVPFEGETYLKIYTSIMTSNEQSLFGQDPWPSVSDGAKDLIMGMMETDVDKRFTASEVLNHPWIQQMEQDEKHKYQRPPFDFASLLSLTPLPKPLEHAFQYTFEKYAHFKG